MMAFWSFHSLNKNKGYMNSSAYARNREEFSNYARNRTISEEKGRRWYNNGIINRFVKECPEGFVIGKLVSEKEHLVHSECAKKNKPGLGHKVSDAVKHKISEKVSEYYKKKHEA